MSDLVLESLRQTWLVFAEAAPWLVFGLFCAGLTRWALPEARLVGLMGRSPGVQVVRATVVGAPLPLCSCGVLPAALGLRRQGLTKPGTAAFLVATPQNGIDSVALSYALLGPAFTIVRVAASAVSALAAGATTHLLDRPTACRGLLGKEPMAAPSCCVSGRTVSLGVVNRPVSAAPALGSHRGTCCSPPAGSTGGETFLSGQRYAFGRFLLDIGGWLMVGLLVAGAMNAFVGADGLAAYGTGLAAMAVVLVISVPMYICASASTPVAASMLMAGASPGVVLVFLLAGPATNVAGLALVKRELGLRATAGYLGGLVISSVGFGLLVDWLLLSASAWSPRAVGAGGHALLPWWLTAGSACVLLAWFGLLNVRQLVAQLRERGRSRTGSDEAGGDRSGREVRVVHT